jgi:hypothetical protein
VHRNRQLVANVEDFLNAAKLVDADLVLQHHTFAAAAEFH